MTSHKNDMERQYVLALLNQELIRQGYHVEEQRCERGIKRDLAFMRLGEETPVEVVDVRELHLKTLERAAVKPLLPHEHQAWFKIEGKQVEVYANPELADFLKNNEHMTVFVLPPPMVD
mgnify:CR=1 FL=1